MRVNREEEVIAGERNKLGKEIFGQSLFLYLFENISFLITHFIIRLEIRECRRSGGVSINEGM